MSIASFSNDSSTASPWQALRDLRTQLDGSSSDSSVSATSFPPPPQPPPTTTDTSTTDGSNTTSASDSTNLDSALAQLIAGLQSFLLNLQSTNGAGATASTDTTDSTTATASTAAAGAATTASTTTTPTTADLFADLGTILGDLQDSSTSQTQGQAQSQETQTDPTASASGATDPAQTTGPADHGRHHHLLADILNALQSYAAQPAQTAQLTTTTALSA